VLPASEGLDVLPVGNAGGPIDVRFPPMLWRGLVMDIDGGLVFEGVPVLEVEVLEAGAVNCFVGDFVGDYSYQLKSRRIMDLTYPDDA